MRFPGQRNASNTKLADSVDVDRQAASPLEPPERRRLRNLRDRYNQPRVPLDPPERRRFRNLRLLLATVACVWLLADQLTKHWAVNALSDDSIDLFWTLRLRLVFNDGAAFGLGSSLAPFITIMVAVLSVLIVLATWRNSSRFVAVIAGLVLGGALGNLGDKAFRGNEGFFRGKVVDFIDFQWWPVFNIADSGITIGVVLFITTTLFSRKAGMTVKQHSPHDAKMVSTEQ